MFNVNINEPVFHPFSTIASKCRGSCRYINDPYPKICVPVVGTKRVSVNIDNVSMRM